MKYVWLYLLLTACLTTHAFGAERPSPIDVDTLPWISPSPVPGLRFTWVLGEERGQGLYLLRVALARGAKIPPHTHPDTRNSTVLAGTLYVGFGKRFDAAALIAVPTGHVYVAPAGVPHFLYARDGDVVYQESGIGPTATSLIR